MDFAQNPEEAVIERFVGGGKAYYTPFVNGAYGTEYELGEVKEAKLKIAPTYIDAMGKDTGFEKKVKKALKEVTASISLSTQNVNTTNMAMAMIGTVETQSFAIGDILPNGLVATEAIEIPKISAGVQPLFEGRLRIVSINIGGDNDPVLDVPMCVITPSGDVRDYFASEFVNLAFEGEILESNGVYFNEYFIPKS